MESKQSLLPCLLLAGCVAMFSHTAFGQDDYVPQRAKVISFPSAANVKELYVAIMGEVANPGTYHLDSTSLKLQSVVQRAGGLNANASPAIRIVRQGRVPHREVYFDNASTPVLPGDLLVVDSKPSAQYTSQTIFTRDPTTVQATYEESSSGVGVQVALVNLVDYPLVLNLRPGDASASNIVEALGQPIGLLANTYVITPDTFPRSSSEEAKRAIRLAQGSVMVFDRDRVNRSRLPSTLPKPIESEISAGAQPVLMGSTWGQSFELRNLGQQMASGNRESNDFNEQFQGRMPQPSSESSTSSSGQPVHERNPEVAPSIGSSKPRIANLPFTGAPRFTNSSTINTRSDLPSSDSIPQPDDSVSDPLSTLITPSPTLEKATSPAASASRWLRFLVLFTVVGTLVGGALILRRVLESNSIDLQAIQMSIPETAASELQTVAVGNLAQSKSLLERLIKNELAISIESVEFPNELILQGKIADKPILRVDGPQSILKQNGPHFGSSVRSTIESVLNEAIVQVDTPEAGTIRRPHFIDNERQKTAATTSSSAGQIADVHASDEQPKAPLAKALFQLEQGGRS